jgi:hypothetical protein
MKMCEGFCTDCGYEIESFEGLSECPFCGTTHAPCSNKEQVNISVNWHELRILAIWAENWASLHKDDDSTMLNCIWGISHRVEKQFPGKPKLTLAGELSDLKREYPTLETNILGIE